MKEVSFFLCNIIVNSFLCFNTVWILVTVVTFRVRERGTRIVVWLYSIAIFKLMADVMMYDFSRWGFLQGVNPLLGVKGSRELIVMLAQFGMGDVWPSLMSMQFFINKVYTFTLADIFMYRCGSGWINFCILCVFTISLCRLGHFLVDSRRQRKELMEIMGCMEPLKRGVKNQGLQQGLLKYGVGIYQVGSIGGPFSFRNREACIIFPRELVKRLEQDEYEAILAHELQHIRCRDGLLLGWLKGICAFYWWIPSTHLLKKIEFHIELCCDRASVLIGMSRLSIVKALAKSACYSKGRQPLAVSNFVGQGEVLQRVKYVLARSLSGGKRGCLVNVLIALSAGVLFIGKLWIF